MDGALWCPRQSAHDSNTTWGMGGLQAVSGNSNAVRVWFGLAESGGRNCVGGSSIGVA